MIGKRRILVVHRAIAPYRIPFFNSLATDPLNEVTYYFEQEQPANHQFDAQTLLREVTFTYRYLKPVKRAPKNLRLDLLSIVRKGQYDLILTSETNLTLWLVLLAVRLWSNHTRVVTMIDDSEAMAQQFFASQRPRLKRFLLKQKRLHGIIFCDKRAEQLHRAQLTKPERHYYTLPILQDEAHIRKRLTALYTQATSLRARYTQGVQEGKIVLFVGRLSPEKNLHRLIASFATLAWDHPKWQLHIVGDGPMQKALEQQITELSLKEQIHLIGRLEGDALYTHYLIADTFVLPSTQEAFGAVVNEALIVGLPTALSQVCGIASLIDEKNYLFDPLDLQEMAASITHSIAESSTPWQVERPNRMPLSYNTMMHRFHADFIAQLFPKENSHRI